MKPHVIYTLLLSILISCNKDLGNYDYHDINEISISGIAESYSALAGVDTLVIHPQIDMTQVAVEENRFDYFWVVKKGRNVVDTAGTSPNLNYAVSLAPDTYSLHLNIIDKKTTVAWTHKSTFTVGNAYTRGIFVIGDTPEGNADVDMIAMVNDTIVIKNILSNSGLPPLQGAIHIQHTGATSGAKIWAFTESGSYHLDRLSLESSTDRTLAPLVYTTDPIDKSTLHPIVMAPQINNQTGTIGSTQGRAMLTQNGHIFSTQYLNNGGDFYTNPINRVAEPYETLLPAAPYMLYPINSMLSFVWYDLTNERFMNVDGFATISSVVLEDRPGDIFPWNQVASGRSLVYGENTRNSDGGAVNGNSFTIMKDQQSDYFIYQFYANGAIPTKIGYFPVKPIALHFEKATQYAFSSKRSVVFYIAENKLYAYDYNPGNERFYQFDIAGGDEISMIKFDTQIDPATNSLYIGTYNATTKGRLQRFEVGTDPNTVSLHAVPDADWSNLVKIKSFSWRAVN